MNIYDNTATKISKVVTTSYSTSFSMATGMLDKKHRDAIYAIYGFVRFADEIVDSFHEFNKKKLLDKFESDLKDAIELGISMNPILHSFQKTVREYGIPYQYIDAFLTSMKCDLNKKHYENKLETDTYVYGSADVVGLMCLRVFTDGDEAQFNKLKKPAMKLGSAFQKVNFLRDLKNDTEELGRIYFPGLVNGDFNEESKLKIIQEIESDFNEAFEGIKQLPKSTRIAVLSAYFYYLELLLQLKNVPAKEIMVSRIRISNFRKISLLLKANVLCKLNLL
ncbi:MAG: phytoene/squalene synthase family protein [Draconibacterium sp.]|nr:phytoene/squalene synthase family protein [Draconibacterium sp.]